MDHFQITSSEELNLCIETFGIIMNSKPDKFHTSILISKDETY